MDSNRDADGWGALAGGTRRAIVACLADGPRAVGQLAAGLPVSRSAVSQHLKILKDAGLVEDVAAGTRRICLSPAVRLTAMRPRTPWMARAWLPYLLAGVLWMTFGSVVLSDPQGLGLIFIGLACLAFGLYGAGWRVLHRHQLNRGRPRR